MCVFEKQYSSVLLLIALNRYSRHGNIFIATLEIKVFFERIEGSCLLEVKGSCVNSANYATAKQLLGK